MDAIFSVLIFGFFLGGGEEEGRIGAFEII